MATYQAASGYNNTAGYANIPTQPRCHGVSYHLEREAHDFTVYGDGVREATLIYDILRVTDFSALLTFFGLTGATRSAKITITLPSEDDRAMIDYNATIKKPAQTKGGGQHERRRMLDVRFELVIESEAS